MRRGDIGKRLEVQNYKMKNHNLGLIAIPERGTRRNLERLVWKILAVNEIHEYVG